MDSAGTRIEAWAQARDVVNAAIKYIALRDSQAEKLGWRPHSSDEGMVLNWAVKRYLAANL
jgi:hypothetical protein